MFLLFLLILIVMFPAAAMLFVLAIHESLTLLTSAHSQPRHRDTRRSTLMDGIKRVSQEITAIMGIGDD